MKIRICKFIFLLGLGIILVTGCNSVQETNKNASNQSTTTTTTKKTDLFLIDEERQIYADFANPRMILNGKIVSVKEIGKTNCTTSCIYNDSEPIKVYKDGGSKLFSYTIEGEIYYVVECHKISGSRNTIISKSDDIVNKC